MRSLLGNFGINNESVFTKKMFKGQELTMPIAHKQGNYIASADILKRLQDHWEPYYN